MEMKPHSNRGFSTMEIVAAATIGLLATALLAETSILATKTFKKVSEVASAHTVGRRAFDMFVADVQKADLSMAKFPAWSSSPWYTAKDDKCIILRQPKFKSDLTVDTKNWTVVTYRLVAASVAADGPFVLKRTESPLMVDPGVSSSASMGTTRTVAKNIKSVQWNQLTNQTFWGDRNTKNFYIRSTPEPDTAQIKLKALIGGEDRLADGKATISGTKVTLYKAMQYGVAMDVCYRIKPETSLNATGDNSASAMFVKVVFQPQWTGNDHTTKTREVTLSAMPQLENKVD